MAAAPRIPTHPELALGGLQPMHNRVGGHPIFDHPTWGSGDLIHLKYVIGGN
jgi:hypothetical protein